jgi:hypothetical protein
VNLVRGSEIELEFLENRVDPEDLSALGFDSQSVLDVLFQREGAVLQLMVVKLYSDCDIGRFETFDHDVDSFIKVLVE